MYLCNETFDRENKTCLRNAILLPVFHILLLFEIIKISGRNFVKNAFFQNWWSHIFASKHQTDKIKHIVETHFFVVIS
jgi:hypothetical protein